MNQFAVTTADNVSEAIHLIAHNPFDVLLCDLHMPGAGNGFIVVSAMRHKNPNAVTLVFTGYPALQEAMAAILLQADEILVKPMDIPALLAVIHEKLQKRGMRKATTPERVASILERDALVTINDWLTRVEREDERGVDRSVLRLSRDTCSICGSRSVAPRARRNPPTPSTTAAQEAQEPVQRQGVVPDNLLVLTSRFRTNLGTVVVHLRVELTAETVQQKHTLLVHGSYSGDRDYSPANRAEVMNQ